MKNTTTTSKGESMLPEYDFTGKKGVRGKYAKTLKDGYIVRILKADGTVEEFNVLIEQARKQAIVAALKRKDIKSAVAKVRGRKK